MQAISPQAINLGGSIGTRNFYFYNWNGTDVSFQNSATSTTGVVFNSENATVNAVMKGQGLSNDPGGLSTPSQRKIVRTADGKLHRVYESMGRVWYETSSNNGQSWSMMNAGQALDNGSGKTPSIAGVCIDGSYNYVVIVYQQAEQGTGYPYTIQLTVFGALTPDGPLTLYQRVQTTSIYSSGYQYSANVASPSVAILPGSNNATVEVTWHISSGLVMKEGGLSYLNSPPYSPSTLRTISSTTSSSINPSIATYEQNNYGHFYIVWEENNIIKYTEYYGGNFINTQQVSYLDGYTYNNTPSLIVLNDALARMCWKGSRFVSQIDPDTKTDISHWDIKTIFRGINTNHYWYFGNDVSSPNINKAEEESYYAIVWNQSENSTFFADNTLSIPRQIGSYPGSSVSLSNGPTKANMYADVFNTEATPYYLKTSNNLGSYYIPQKINSYNFASGREGTVTKDTAHFYFTIGDVLVDNQPIDFIDIPDSVVFNSKEILNTYLLSNTFQLTDNSSFEYSIQYGISDSVAAAQVLSNSGNFISFNLELVDAQTSEVLGNYDAVTYDESNIYQYNSFSYQVNTSGIGNREVYLKLVTDDNFDPGYSLSEIHTTGNVLEKVAVKSKNYDGMSTITDYKLAQNYPNPFNPTTTINYQLPQNGYVTLKVYDILGKEVATLVNEQKNQGRYSVNFDASKLASGVYIYRIQVNDYVSSRKMLLVK